MQIDIRQAIKFLYKSHSLENVFIEAIHNSIDANASKIDIEISIEAFDKPETLIIKITDNGVGFTDERYGKFCKLMTVDEDTHRGAGRLVYLYYFEKISISSKYDRKQRTFTYDSNFDEYHSDMQEIELNEAVYETTIVFENCTLAKLNSYSTISPKHMRTVILHKFYPALYLLKKSNKNIDINIKLNVENEKKGIATGKRETHISLSDVPALNIEEVDLNMFEMFADSKIHYSIKKQEVLTDPLR